MTFGTHVHRGWFSRKDRHRHRRGDFERAVQEVQAHLDRNAARLKEI
jgi:hypothetical protein